MNNGDPKIKKRPALYEQSLWAITIVVVLGVAVTGFGMLWIASHVLESHVQETANSTTRILAERSEAAVSFHDAEAAHRGLEPIVATGLVHSAAIVLPTNEILAQIDSDNREAPPVFNPDFEDRWTHDSLEERRLIRGGKATLGQVVLRFNLGPLRENEQKIYWLLGLAMLVAICCSGFLARYLLRGLTTPVQSLTTFVTKVREQGDYALRCKIDGCRELDTLATAFNSLLEHIQVQNAELTEQKVRAQGADRVKANFLANMSHEIRTPINGVMGVARLLEDTKLDREQQDLLEVLKMAASSLLGVVNDILDFSQLEAGKLPIAPKRASLWDMANRVLASIRRAAEQKRIGISLAFGPEIPANVAIDELRVSQIIFNLLSNAIKFTAEAGSIHLNLSCPSPSRLRIDVVDTGVGIPKEKIVEIFQPFVQADSSLTRKFGGTGLGLSICYRLIELMGGEISVVSEVGRGSTFSVELPFGEIATSGTDELPLLEKEASQAGGSKNAKRLLLVEDTPLNQKLIRKLLEKRGYQVELAENGQQALKALENEGFALVLMDCQMPVMDGFTATKLLRGSTLPNRRIPVVALTAHAMSGDREQCLAAGMDDYLTKPLDMDELERVLERFIGVARHSPSPPQNS